MSMLSKQSRLKRQLKRKYVAWNSILDEYSCGMALARHMSPRIGRLENDMLRIKAKLIVLGEDVPKFPWESES
jgi:hypothetical protein